jgi:hypothetical protein
MKFRGGRQGDVLNAVDGENGNDFVDGGRGHDICRAHQGDTVIHCEDRIIV